MKEVLKESQKGLMDSNSESHFVLSTMTREGANIRFITAVKVCSTRNGDIVRKPKITDESKDDKFCESDVKIARYFH